MKKYDLTKTLIVIAFCIFGFSIVPYVLPIVIIFAAGYGIRYLIVNKKSFFKTQKENKVINNSDVIDVDAKVKSQEKL